MKQRYVLIPGENRFNRGQPLRSDALMARSATAMRAARSSTFTLDDVPEVAGSKLDVVCAIDTEKGVDAMLVELDDDERLNLHASYPDLRVVAEGEARMAFARVELQPLDFATMAGRSVRPVMLTVRARGADGKPIAKALVQLVADDDPFRGVEARTDARGVAKLPVPPSLRKALYLLVEPLHSYWPTVREKPGWRGSATFELECPSIDDDYAGVLSVFGGPGAPNDGHGVVVGVIDGGAGPHRALPVFEGVDLSAPERPRPDASDNGIGHGTHVAGIIAGQGGRNGIVGMAPGVTLKVYRVYGKGKQDAGGFAVAAAIRKAIEDRVDLINLSLYFDHDDLAVVRQVQAARANGAVCIAAAGNSGDAVKMPARHDAVLGVSAIGCRGCWPEHASMDLDVLTTPRGANRKHFVARFSCTGPEIDLAGGGVGVVSLFPGNRRAIMTGTSMASPAVTGLIARRLAKQPNILAMPRDQARSDAIVKLALDSAKSLGFPRRFQGRGSLP